MTNPPPSDNAHIIMGRALALAAGLRGFRDPSHPAPLVEGVRSAGERFYRLAMSLDFHDPDSPRRLLGNILKGVDPPTDPMLDDRRAPPSPRRVGESAARRVMLGRLENSDATMGSGQLSSALANALSLFETNPERSNP